MEMISMPPKAKITKEMVIEAGLNIVREDGQENLNVRSIAAKLGCSTQPVMYHYETVNDLKADIYAAADSFHTGFITSPEQGTDDPMLSIGLRYIRFADEEKNLFRFLFQSDKFRNTGFRELIGAEGNPAIKPLCEAAKLTEAQAKEVFATLFICVHGIASLLANNSIDYDEEYFSGLLRNTLFGAVAVLKGSN